MILSETAIKRPVFATMVLASIVVFGIVSYRNVGIDMFPKVELPVITIISSLPGADPASVESTVSQPIEEAVGTISGLKHLRSVSTEGVSQVVMEFNLEKNVDVAYQEIQAKVGAIRAKLPRDLEEPVVEKLDIDAVPVLVVVVSGAMEMRDLTHTAEKVVKERLHRVPNVAQIAVVGGQKRKFWIWINRDRLEGRRLTIGDVEAAVHAEHVDSPGGRLQPTGKELVVKTRAEFHSAKELENLTITARDGAVIKLSEVAHVEDGLEEQRSLAQLDATRAVALVVRRQSGANTVEVALAVKKEVARMKVDLASSGIRLEIAQDASIHIEHSVAEVRRDLVLGGILAVVIVFMFLRNFRSSLISALVLPTSVIGTFIAMSALGFTQNMMTLLALSLAIGLLIDDAIVVQENIMRHVEEGMPARQAASFATSEIALAVFATTLSVVAVFVPVAFMRGLVGRFFYQFGITVSCAVLISMFVSFTLDPMLSSRILRKPDYGLLYRFSERGFVMVESIYRAILGWSLRWRFAVILIAIASFAGAGMMSGSLRSEFSPVQDQSEFNVVVSAPLGSSLSATEAVLTRIRTELAGQPWLRYTYASIGSGGLQRVNEGTLYVRMTDKGTRAMGQMEAMAWLRERLAAIHDARISVEPFAAISLGGGSRNAQVTVDLRGPDTEVLKKISKDIMARMKSAGGYVDIDTTYEEGRPEVGVYVKRDRAADLGVRPSEVASTVRAMIGGDVVGTFQAAGERFDIAVRLEQGSRQSTADIRRLSVRSGKGELVSMQNVAEIAEGSGPVQINRYNGARQITVLANLDNRAKVLGQATEEVRKWAGEIGLPGGYEVDMVGQAETMKESFQDLLFALFLAVIIVYMVLASQFESFIHPFTIMISLPLSVVGALGALAIFKMTVSIFTLIGIILLMGLVTKNAILLVDYTNTLRERDGLSRLEALLKAGPTRLRPILMTTLAMIFGMLPVALGTGAGSESRAPMAVAVIGGLITSTLLTLVVVPVVYTFMDTLQSPSQWWFVKRFRRSPG
jgi:hydrophobic/amphiphilic exporter-1 (mainly G- bacteria), HAE1 family